MELELWSDKGVVLLVVKLHSAHVEVEDHIGVLHVNVPVNSFRFCVSRGSICIRNHLGAFYYFPCRFHLYFTSFSLEVVFRFRCPRVLGCFRLWHANSFLLALPCSGTSCSTTCDVRTMHGVVDFALLAMLPVWVQWLTWGMGRMGKGQ